MWLGEKASQPGATRSRGAPQPTPWISGTRVAPRLIATSADQHVVRWDARRAATARACPDVGIDDQVAGRVDARLVRIEVAVRGAEGELAVSTPHRPALALAIFNERAREAVDLRQRSELRVVVVVDAAIAAELLLPRRLIVERHERPVLQAR